ncbi:hypothetical protein SAMN02745121_05717 [Nannocystis exedens]|uniref:Uncharacterized protein n=1 Tax=Nannocystis exedens TaxID=54 RepID=A0A1I2DS16_9BACT|nr:hypothetical protein [Nannocystis exedens]PCC68950.1 hypothetical protein NAEX_01971 [Nannocystis exedens]SFE83258.1 hypothetical protein SAMN02745121_05717 [Nannocystis exedens]
MRLNLQHALLLLAAAACTPHDGGTTDASGSTTTTDAASTTAGTGEDASSTTSTTAATTDAPTTGDPTTTATSSTTGESAYCWGFDVDAPAPFLELYDFEHAQLAEGVTLPLECGGQGSWMFGLYPEFGGYEPAGDSVVFDLTVDVEGYNINPAGHFFSGEVYYYVGCDDILGGVLGVVPIIPPDELPDPAVLDGLSAEVHVELDAGGQLVSFDATMPLSAPMELTQNGCMFGLADPPADLRARP